MEPFLPTASAIQSTCAVPIRFEAAGRIETTREEAAAAATSASEVTTVIPAAFAFLREGTIAFWSAAEITSTSYFC